MDEAGRAGNSDVPPRAGRSGAAAPAAGSDEAERAGSGGEPPATAGSGAPGCTTPNADDVEIELVNDAVLAAPNPALELRSGPSALVGDRVFWAFGTVSSGPFMGGPVASWITLESLRGDAPRLSEAPRALLPEEPLNELLWSVPTSAWTVQDNDAERSVHFFFSRFYIIEPVHAGLARSTVNDPFPARVISAPTVLFPVPEGADLGRVFRPRALHAARQVDELLYAYDCSAPPGAPAAMDPARSPVRPCRLLRVLATQAHQGASYEFWSDGQWVSDITRASVVFEDVPGGLSVRHNGYLNKYIAVHSGRNNDVRLWWSDALEGPFHALGSAVSTAPGAGGDIPLSTGANELPVPHERCDRELLVSYWLPLEETLADDSKTTRAQTHVMRLRLQ